MMLTVFDGSYMLHRTCHIPSFESLQTTDGRQTGGAFGVVKSVHKILHTFHSRRAVFVWDDVRRSERRERIFPEYKANRMLKQGDDGFEERERFNTFYNDQRNLVANLLEHLGVKQITIRGKEADDIVAFIVKSCKGRCVVVTSDKDYYQLVDQNTAIWCPAKETHIDLDNFVEVAGVEISQFLLAKAILGDVSDNIPGVKGIGQKTVVQLMAMVRGVGAETAPDLLAALVQIIAKDGSTRQRKVLEQAEVIVRNLELMDLSKEEFSYDEMCQIMSGATVGPSFNEQAILDHFRALQFGEFMRDFLSFSAPFRMLS